MLRIEIKDIGPAGVQVQQKLECQEVRRLLGQEIAVDEGADAHGAFEFSLERLGDTVRIKGRIEATFHLPCARCLEPAKVELSGEPLSVTFLPPASEDSDEDAVLEADDLETYHHDGTVIDLEALVHEQLVLAIPIAPYCRVDCRGICGRCGTDLNKESCACTEEKKEQSAWSAALEQLKRHVAS